MRYQFIFNKYNSKRKGYIALLSVIALSALGVAIMLVILLSGVSASKTDFALQQSASANIAASSCGEEALEVILETGTSSTSGGLSFTSGSCSYTVTSENGQNITINSIGSVGTTVSRVQIIVATTTPYIILSSWKEVEGF